MGDFDPNKFDWSFEIMDYEKTKTTKWQTEDSIKDKHIASSNIAGTKREEPELKGTRREEPELNQAPEPNQAASSEIYIEAGIDRAAPSGYYEDPRLGLAGDEMAGRKVQPSRESTDRKARGNTRPAQGFSKSAERRNLSDMGKPARDGEKGEEISSRHGGQEETITVSMKNAKDTRRHHHHHRRKGPLRRLRHWYRKHRITISVIVLLIIISALAGGYIVWKRTKLQKRQHVASTNSYDMGNGYRTIQYDGKEYRYNNLITTFLYAGLDGVGPMETYTKAGDAPRADSIYLIVMDKKNEKMSIITINRNTQTRIRRYSLFFESWDYYDTFLCYAFPFGDGRKTSCDNLLEAVSYLLGVPVNEYIITNRDSISSFNNMAGGVEVTVPNDDLKDILPGAKKGKKLWIEDDMVETYVRYRDTSIPFSNNGRIQRQESYISAFVRKMKEIVAEDRNKIWDRLEDMNQYMLTSVTRNKYIQYAKLLNTVGFDEADFYEISGENVIGDYYEEFYPDKEEIKKLVIDLFYEAV